MRPVTELELPLPLDRTSTVPLHRQLADALRSAILAGRLMPGARLPATRQIAQELGLSRATVLTAYEQLLGEGCLVARHGSGTFVAPRLTPITRPGSPVPTASAVAGSGGRVPREVVDLRPGRPDTSRLVDPAWRRAWREAGRTLPSGEPPAAGLPGLREEIAAHLRAARGLDVEATDVVVVAGTADGLALSAYALGLTGGATDEGAVAVEDPGYPGARRCLRRLGCRLHPVGVDEHGLRVADLPPRGVGAVLVTPSHQYPLGAVLPLERRTALLHWARTHAATILEDDYDSEFRYGATPLPALAGLDRDRVVHLGTFSKVLTPWLRTGYVVVPPRLRATFLAVRRDLGAPVSGIQQEALRRYLAGGALRRHVARCRRDYAHRRRHLLRLLASEPLLDSRQTNTGLHCVVTLPAGTDTPALLQAVRDEGYRLADLAEYEVRPDDATRPPRPAVVLGYGDARLADLGGAVQALTTRLRNSTP